MFCDCCILRRSNIGEAIWYLRCYEQKFSFLSWSCHVTASCLVLKGEFDVCFVCMYLNHSNWQSWGDPQNFAVYPPGLSQGMWWGFPERLAWLNSGCLAGDLLQGIISPFWKGTLSLNTCHYNGLLKTHRETILVLLLTKYCHLGWQLKLNQLAQSSWKAEEQLPIFSKVSTESWADVLRC